MLLLTPSDTTDVPGPATEWLWARTADAQRVDSHGRDSAAQLPTDRDTVLLLPPGLVSWHLLDIPKVATSRLRAVLEGLLEDRLLDEPGQLHFALAPGARPGQTTWVAALKADWLRAALAALQRAGHPVGRVVPLLWPQAEPSLLSFERGGQVWLAASGPLGVATLPAHATNTPTGTQAWLDRVSDGPAFAAQTPCLSEPASAAVAERLLQRPPNITPTGELLLRAAQGPWDLAQFEFSQSAQARRGHWLRDTGRALLFAPVWRPLRWGLAALLLLQLVALNVTAWRSQQALLAKQTQAKQVLTQTFPQTTLVLDAPVQMRRAVAELRQTSGEASARDLEALLQDLAPAMAQWDTLSYGPGQATLQGFRPAPNTGGDWQNRLEAAGWTVQLAGEPPVLTLKARP